MKTFLKSVLVGLSVTAAAMSASAAEFPSKPITMVIPFPPAGTADVIGRPLASELSKRLKMPVVIEYKGGAGGSIGTQFVAKAAPDGYTILLVLASHAINPSLYKRLGFDTLKDFTSVSKVAQLPLVLYTNPQFPPKTVSEFIAYAKANPGKVSVASSGNGLTSHLATELMADMAGLQLLHVPYKGGGPAITAAMGGEVQAIFAGPDSLNFAKAGRLRMLAMTGNERWSYAPEVPTVAESGLKGFEVYGWYGIVAPAGTPADVVQVLNRQIGAVLQDPAFKKQVEPLGYTTTASTPVEFDAFLRAEIKRWAEVIRKADIKLE